jgi:PAS domain S-box-containing protein
LRAPRPDELAIIERTAHLVTIAIERARNDQAVRASEERFRRSFHEAATGMSVTALDGRFLEANAAFCRTVGYNEEELRARDFTSITHPDDRDENARLLAELVDGRRQSFVFEKRYLHQQGSTVWARISVSADRDADGRPMRIIGVMEDITAERRARQQLRESEERFRLLSKATNDAIWDWDLVTDLIWWNDGFTTLFGFTRDEIEPTIVSWTGRIHPEDLQGVTAAVDRAIARGDASWSGEYRFRRKDGSYAYVLDRGYILREPDGRAVRMIGGMTDLTERRQLEQQYLRAQRLESIGTLAGGIAHDLNNVLAPVLMSIGLLQMDERDPERREILSTIEQSAKRGAEMVRQVLSFARGLEGRRIEIHLSHLLRDVMRITNDTFPKNIRVEAQMAPDLWPLLADPTQLHQVLLNLCVNARDAMPNGGRLTIRATNMRVDEHYAAMNIEARVGPHLQIDVEDTGAGIAAEHLDKVFDPFFTTKDLGKGTGLGLSTSLAIVKSHGGFIRVTTEPGQGSCFRVFLPAQAAGTAVDSAVAADAALPRGHGETVLVVDDEAAVRQITKQTLESFGYDVVVAADGSEAVSIYVQNQDRIALVLTDMMMPIMDGPATIRVLRRLNPGVRVIGASGVAVGDGPAPVPDTGIRHFLPKPYTADTLLTMVRQALDEPPPHAG